MKFIILVIYVMIAVFSYNTIGEDACGRTASTHVKVMQSLIAPLVIGVIITKNITGDNYGSDISHICNKKD